MVDLLLRCDVSPRRQWKRTWMIHISLEFVTGIESELCNAFDALPICCMTPEEQQESG